jgi:hypothetical protein
VNRQRFTLRNCIMIREHVKLEQHMARSIAANIARLPDLLRKP